MSACTASASRAAGRAGKSRPTSASTPPIIVPRKASSSQSAAEVARTTAAAEARRGTRREPKAYRQMVLEARVTSVSEPSPGIRSNGISVSARTGAAVTARSGRTRKAAGLSANIATVAHEKHGRPSWGGMTAPSDGGGSLSVLTPCLLSGCPSRRGVALLVGSKGCGHEGAREGAKAVAEITNRRSAMAASASATTAAIFDAARHICFNSNGGEKAGAGLQAGWTLPSTDRGQGTRNRDTGIGTGTQGQGQGQRDRALALWHSGTLALSPTPLGRAAHHCHCPSRRAHALGGQGRSSGGRVTLPKSTLLSRPHEGVHAHVHTRGWHVFPFAAAVCTRPAFTVPRWLWLRSGAGFENEGTGHLPEAFTSGNISVLYKKGDPREPRNYRPITLVQVDYKIYSKALVKRMKPVVDTIYRTIYHTIYLIMLISSEPFPPYPAPTFLLLTSHWWGKRRPRPRRPDRLRCAHLGVA
eukprot:scaffold23600_cov120-Isochrysis_galbana.AAC.5